MEWAKCLNNFVKIFNELYLFSMDFVLCLTLDILASLLMHFSWCTISEKIWPLKIKRNCIVDKSLAVRIVDKSLVVRLSLYLYCQMAQ